MSDERPNLRTIPSDHVNDLTDRPRARTNLSEMTDDEKLAHRRAKTREKSRRWRAANPEKHREQVAAWEAANPDKVKGYRQKASANYNETHKEERRKQWRDWNARNKPYRQEYARARSYEQKYNITVGICETDKSGGAGRWHIDHHHGTGAVRGLLCTKCNTGGGLFNDDPALLRKAADWFAQ